MQKDCIYKKLIKDKLNIDDNNNNKAFSVVRGQWFLLHRYLAKTELNIMMPFKKSLYCKIFWRKGIIWPSDFQLISRSLIYLKFWITKYTNCARSSKSMLHFIRKGTNHLFLMHLFSTPWKHQKTVMFSGGEKGCIGKECLTLWMPRVYIYVLQWSTPWPKMFFTNNHGGIYTFWCCSLKYR